MLFTANNCSQKAPEQRGQLATPSPSVKDARLTRTHSFASPARTARTARTKRKRRRNEADLPVRGVGQAGLAPPNLQCPWYPFYMKIRNLHRVNIITNLKHKIFGSFLTIVARRPETQLAAVASV